MENATAGEARDIGQRATQKAALLRVAPHSPPWAAHATFVGGPVRRNNRAHKYDASMLGGQWSDPGGGCYDAPHTFTITPMGDDAFELSCLGTLR